MAPRGRKPLAADKLRSNVQLVRFTDAELARLMRDLERWRKDTGQPLASLAAFIRSRLFDPGK